MKINGIRVRLWRSYSKEFHGKREGLKTLLLTTICDLLRNF
jgi:hypothetical protein